MRRMLIAGLLGLVLAGGARAEDGRQAALDAYARAVGFTTSGIFAPSNFSGGLETDVQVNSLLSQLGFSGKSIDPAVLRIRLDGDRKSGLRIESADTSAFAIRDIGGPVGDLRVGSMWFSTMLRNEPAYALRGHFTVTNIDRPATSQLDQNKFTIGAWQFLIDAQAVDKNTDRVRLETEVFDFLEGWHHGGGSARKASLAINLGAVPHGDVLRYLAMLDPATRFIGYRSLNPLSPRLNSARDIDARLTLFDATIGMACPVLDRIEIGMKADWLSAQSPLQFDVSATSLNCPIDPFMLGLAGLYNDDMELSATVRGVNIGEVLGTNNSDDADQSERIDVEGLVLRGKNRFGELEFRGRISFLPGQFTPHELDMVMTASGAGETLDAIEREKRGKPEFEIFYATGFAHARDLVKLGESDGAGKLRWKITYAAGGKVTVNGHSLPTEMAVGSALMMAVNFDAELRQQAEEKAKSALPKIE